MGKDSFEEFSLEKYANDLYNRRHGAVELFWADCGNDEWAPQENNCHKNVTELCSLNKELKPIRGWLYFHVQDINMVRFVAHSVVKAPDGKYYDITPPNDVKRPPFIIATESGYEFENIVINIGDFSFSPES